MFKKIAFIMVCVILLCGVVGAQEIKVFFEEGESKTPIGGWQKIKPACMKIVRVMNEDSSKFLDTYGGACAKKHHDNSGLSDDRRSALVNFMIDSCGLSLDYQVRYRFHDTYSDTGQHRRFALVKVGSKEITKFESHHSYFNTRIELENGVELSTGFVSLPFESNLNGYVSLRNKGTFAGQYTFAYPLIKGRCARFDTWVISHRAHLLFKIFYIAESRKKPENETFSIYLGLGGGETSWEWAGYEGHLKKFRSFEYGIQGHIKLMKIDVEFRFYMTPGYTYSYPAYKSRWTDDDCSASVGVVWRL